jgi:uncharacterized membrane protein
LSKALNKLTHRPTTAWHRQRGASAILVAVMLFALLSALLAALDVGRLYLAQRDLQRLANLSALDGARAIGGCRGPVSDPQGVATAAVRSNIQANGGNVAILDHSLSSVELGVVTRSAGLRGFAVAPPEEAVAVNVTLVDPAPQRILPMFSSGAGNLRAQAAAFSAPVAALSVGSSLASLDATDSAVLNAVLGGLLGVPPGGLALDAVSYRGLANAQVSLQQLVDTGVVAGGVEDFLITEITAPSFLTALGTALSNTDPALAALIDQIAAVADPGRTVLPGALFPVEAGLESVVASLPVNVGDLLSAIALAAAQGAPVNLPVPVSLPGVASANLQIKVIEPPQFGGPGRPGIGANGQPRVQAHTAQALLQLDIALTPININLPPLTSINLAAELHLYLTLAQATAAMTGLTCASPIQPFHSVTVDVDTGLASLGLGTFDDLASANPQPITGPPLVDTNVNILTLPPIGLRVDANAGPIDVGTEMSRELLFEGPFVPQLAQASPANTQRVGTPVGAALDTALADLASSLDLDVTLSLPAVGVLLRPLLNTVAGLLTSQVAPALASAISPVLSAVDDALLNPLLDILGLDLGAADVTVESVRISQPDPFGSGDRPYVELITH